MAQCKVTQKREDCIGCGSCVVLCPEFWEMAEDGKSRLKGSKLNKSSGLYEREIAKPDCNEDAAEACPVQIIKVVKL